MNTLNYLIICLFSISAVQSQSRSITRPSTCAANGEYCLRHSDCCSNSCLSFSYKCVQNNQLELQLAQNANRDQPEYVSVTDLVNRFGGNDIEKKPLSSIPVGNAQLTPATENRIAIPQSSPSNTNVKPAVPATPVACKANSEYCVNHWDCCSNSCLSFAYRCVPRSQASNDQVSLIWTPAETTQNSNIKPNDVINRFGSSDNLPGTNATPSPKCAKQGEYCQNSWDCCSNRCLSFSYKCVQNNTAQAPAQAPVLVVGPSIHTVVLSEEQKKEELLANVDAIVDRFGGGDVSTQTISSPPRQPTTPIKNNENVVNTCKAVGNRCRNSDDCCSLKCDRNLNICRRPYPTVEIYNQANGQSNSYANHITQCLPNGIKCLANSECCTGRCHGFLHQCVT